MTVEQEVDALTAAVDTLKSTVVSKKATLDASVSDAQAATALATTAKTAALSARDQASASKDAAYAYAQSAGSAVAYQDLTALAASKAVTAVDVFIYDTSKDSDGGAWRHRCTGTSWYNETLNTATRGSRREFPAVAVIVAEATKITIYDGDDPALPMWMVFTGTYNNMVAIGSGYVFTSVAALNGQLAVGHHDGARAGLDVVSFISDLGDHYGTTQIAAYGSATYAGNIAQRNDNLGNVANLSLPYGLNSRVNDVAMTVLPDAPIDPATGLPVPTIAVATAGGLSVIGNDGAVQSVAPISYANHNYVKNVMISGEEVFITAWSSTQQHTAAVYDIETLSFKREYQTYAPLGKIVTPFEHPIGITINKLAHTGNVLALGSSQNPVNSACPFKGVGLIAENRSDRAKGMSAILSATYNTGWMPGDIKGAFLSSADTASVTGNQIITDPTFDTGDGWTVINPENGTWTIANGVARCTSGGVVFLRGPLLQTGKAYVAEFEIKNYVSGTARLYNDGANAYIKSVNANGVHRVSFVATSGTWKFVGYETDNFDLDNVYIWEADHDRSVEANHLIVNGTVTRSPVATGAELVAYSGFSTSNYLEQPYNSDLDFGTGDFCVMGWVNTTGQSECILHRAVITGGIFIQVTAGGVVQVYATGTTSWGTPLKGTVPVSNGTWRFVTVKRASGVLSISIDGVQDVSAANTNDLTYANTVTRVGLRKDGLEQWDNGSLALLRISATAPTAEQIKKIYEDEKVLFQENAACTLYGASDAVTALAHDPDTGLLHVGTSAGRSVFKGLRRVANTTQAVGTAISAANGMVIEE